MKSTAPFKRGDTFSLTCTWKVDGAAVDITGLTITSQLRSADGGLIDDLRVVAGNQTTNTGQFTLLPTDVSTAAWPLGDAYCDIQVDDQGIDRSSETFIVPIVEDVTR